MGSANEKLSLKERLGYVSNQIGVNSLYTVISSFLLLFYTDYAGISPAVAGMIILVSKFFDGASDLAVGAIFDRTHTPEGSIRPWIRRMIVPILLAWLMMFYMPPVANIGKIVYMFITYNIVNTVLYTIIGSAVTALPTYMTGDTQQRSNLYVLAMFVACGVQTLTAMFFMRAIIYFGNTERSWLIVGAIMGTVGMISLLVVYRTTKERVVPIASKEEDIPVLESLKIIVTNKYWLLMLAQQFMIVLLQIVILTVGVYYAKYVMQNVALSGNLVMYFGLPGLFWMALVIPKLTVKIGKRNTSLLGVTMILIGALLSVFNAQLLPIALMIIGSGFAFMMSLSNAMIADTIEYSEWKSGKRPQSMTMAASTLANKVGAGVSNALLGIYLSASGYDIDPTCATSVAAIHNLFIYAPIVIAIVMIIIFATYDLDKKYDGYVADIAERKAKAASKEN